MNAIIFNLILIIVVNSYSHFISSSPVMPFDLEL